MKKLTVLFAAVVMALSSYAACNEYGWHNKGEMFLALQADCNDTIVKAGKYAMNVVKEENDSIFYMVNDAWLYWKDVEDAHTAITTVGDFFAYSYNKHEQILYVLQQPKWSWLLDVMKANFEANRGADTWDPTYAPVLRSNIEGFFFTSPSYKGGDANPWSYDYAQDGQYVNFQPVWGEEFCVDEDCNEYGWKNKGEMFLALQADCNDTIVKAGKYAMNVVKEENDSIFYMVNDAWFYWKDVEDAHTAITTVGDFFAYSYNKHEQILYVLQQPKWSWLLDVMKANFEANRGADTWNPTYAPVLRSNIEGFFFTSPSYKGGDANPWSYDYAQDGQYVNFQPVWGEKFCTGTANVTVSYDLGGGVTNEYGWTKAEDMYWDFVGEFNARVGSEVVTEFGPTKFYEPTWEASGTVNIDAIWATLDSVKWNWLRDYIIAKTAENKSITDSAALVYAKAYASVIRGGIDNFFNNNDYNLGVWNQSFDGKINGIAAYAKYAPYWKGGFDNPTEFPASETLTLNQPYKEGETFRGWFANSQGAGDPLTELSSIHNGMTIHAIFGAYVYNLKEVWQLYDSMAVGDTLNIRTAGVVTFVNGNQFYMQDEFGGMVTYSKSHGLNVGDKATIEGQLISYNGAPEMINLKKIEVASTGNEVKPVTVVASELALTYAGHCFTKVFLESMKLASVTKNNLLFVDGRDTITFFNTSIDTTAYTAGRRYQVTGILAPYSGKVASLKGGRQFMGDPKWLNQIAGIPADTCHYEVFQAENEYQAGDMVDYTITSNWLISENMGNWAANKPNPAAEQCRGMVVKNGIIYITWRQTNTPEIGTLKLIRYDAASGDRLDDLFLKDYVFQEPASDTTGTRVYMDPDTYITYLAEGYEWNYDEFNSGAYVFGPNTDLEIDDAGNILVANLPTEGHVYQIWKIDENTGDGELIVYVGGTSDVTDFADRFAEHAAIRLDRFDVAGDVTKDAIIMAPSQNSNFVYEMDVVDGKWDGECYSILCANGDVAFSYSPRIDVVDDGTAFYVDGFATYPELFDATGNLLESFKGVFDEEGTEIQPECLAKLYNEDGVSAPAGICGCREFMCGGAYFFVMGAGSYEGSFKPFGTNFIYRFKDGNRHFAEMNHAWNISANGFGATKNAQFNYEFRPIVKDGVTTELYAFVAENGLGKYTITASKNIEPETGLEVVKAKSAEGVQKALINGRLYIVKNGKAFNAVGAIVK